MNNSEMNDGLTIAGKTYNSRLLVGSGKYRDLAQTRAATDAAGDIALGITTSGNSPNVLRALEEANRRGLVTIALTGRGGEAGTVTVQDRVT